MTSRASMIKRIPATGVLTDKTPDLFTRNGSPFHGFARIGDACVLLEVSDTPETRKKGLMGRKNLPECCGMLFTELEGGAFWMKNCLIPLDIVFIKDGKVTKTYSMSADNGAKKYYYDDETEAIELPFGFCTRHGIQTGSPCDWRTW